MSLFCVEKGQMFVPLGMSKFSTLLMALLATAVSEAAVSQMSAPALAGPVVCTTTLEASDSSAGSALVPVEVTTCGPTETTSALLNRRMYTWTAPFPGKLMCPIQLPTFWGLQWLAPVVAS